jgi:hypothetical protein
MENEVPGGILGIPGGNKVSWRAGMEKNCLKK